MNAPTQQQRQTTFPGGLILAAHKSQSLQQSVQKMPLVDQYIIPLQQHIGDAAIPQVKPGDTVLKGQLLAAASAPISAAVHAPTSGTIVAIEERPVAHPAGLNGVCIVLQSDHQETALAAAPKTTANSLTAEQLRACFRKAGIAGLGGAVFPTDAKILQPVKTLIINAAECEPYISCDDAAMREYAEQIVAGARLLQQACQAQRVIIAVENDKPEAIAALTKHEQTSVEIITVPSHYPQGGERQLIQTLTGQEVPYDGLPLDIGILCQNVGTALAAYRAVENEEPLISRIVTVTGSGVANPCNLEVPIGTPISDVIAFCGGYTEKAKRLIMGGPLMGFALAHDNIPVVKATNCLLVAGEADISEPTTPMPCIRCGECAEVCPASLLPQQLYWHAQAQEYDRTEDYNLFDCIECGCCDLACPSHIPLTGWFRYAKMQIRDQSAERAKAEIARQRYEARTQRLEKEQTAREEKRRKKQAELKAKDPKAEIAAALARAKKKKQEQSQD